MIKISYENSLGVTLNLNDGAYFVNANDLRNFAWDYDVLGRPSGLGGRVRRFARPYAEKRLRVAIRGPEFKARANTLLALTEPDILTRTPGKLWLDGQYLICYLAVASELTVHSRRVGFAEKELSLLAVEPFWHTDVTQNFSPGGGAIAGGKKYSLRYPYRFGTGYSNQALFNAHYAGTPMKITIFGPVEDPEVYIAGHKYAVAGELLAGERLEIDQTKGTITKIDASGGKYNFFNARDKESDIFTPCPAGTVPVSFGDVVFEVTLIQQRSEPRWI